MFLSTKKLCIDPTTKVGIISWTKTISMTQNNEKFKDGEAEIATGNPKSNESFSFLEIKILEHAFTLFLFSN